MIVGILLSTLAACILGFIWYSPTVFGEIWFRNAYPGKKMTDLPDSTTPLVFSVASNICSSVVIQIILRWYVGVVSVNQALVVSFLLALLTISSQMTHRAFEKRPIALLLINSGYDTICFLAMALITSNV